MTIIDSLKFMTAHPLTRGSPISTFARFVKWQIGSRLVPGAIVFDWINGSKVIVRRGDTGFTGNIYAGLDEFPEMGYLLHVLRSDELFVDVGANVGAYTILACAAAGARGLAFEPIPNTYRRLVDNIRINHLEQRVKCLNVGVGSEAAEVFFTGHMDTQNHVISTTEDIKGGIPVALRTLDESLGGDTPSVIKIDVEGYETPALDGADATLRHSSLHTVIIELNGGGNRYGFDESQILDRMSDYGFHSYSYDPLKRCLQNIKGRHPTSDNTIFIRNPAWVQQRLASSGHMRIYGKDI